MQHENKRMYAYDLGYQSVIFDEKIIERKFSDDDLHLLFLKGMLDARFDLEEKELCGL